MDEFLDIASGHKIITGFVGWQGSRETITEKRWTSPAEYETVGDIYYISEITSYNGFLRGTVLQWIKYKISQQPRRIYP